MSEVSSGNRKIEVCFSPHSYEVYKSKDTIVVIVDILRATSAICTAFEYGVKSIIPVATIAEAKKFKQQGYLVGAERDGSPVEGFDFGNSPYNYMTDKIKGQHIVLTTTNGTQAIEVSKDAYRVVIGSFLNIHALCKWLTGQNKNVLLLCSGWKNRFNLEDGVFAGAIAEELSKDPAFHSLGDSALAAKYLYQSAKEDIHKFLRNSSHKERLARLNLKEDIKYCFKIGNSAIIPVLEGNALVKSDY